MNITFGLLLIAAGMFSGWTFCQGFYERRFGSPLWQATFVLAVIPLAPWLVFLIWYFTRSAP